VKLLSTVLSLLIFFGLQPSLCLACSFEELTKDCQVFNSNNNDRISLPDGTFIPNYSSLVKYNKGITLATKLDDVDNSQLTYMRTTALNCLKVKVAIKEGSRKIFDLPDCDTLYSIFGQGDPSKDSRKVTVEWPPEKPKGLQDFTIKDLRREFSNRVGKNWQKIAQLVDQAKNFRPESHPSYVSKLEKDMNDVSPIRINRVNGLFDFVKDSLINVILAGRDPSQLSLEETEEVKRIEKIDLNSSPAVTEALCSYSNPNAFYSTATHKFVICKNLFNLPDSALVSVMGHEMAHSIDPCVSQFPLYKINSEALKEIPESEIKANDETLHFKRALNYQEQGVNYTTDDFALNYSEDTIKFYETHKVLTRTTDGISPSKNPFTDVLTCLNVQKGIRKEDSQRVVQMAQEIADYRAENPYAGYDKESDIRKMVHALSSHPECL